MSKAISPNNREIISARSTVTGAQEYLTSTNGALNTTATISAAGVATSDNQTNGDQLTQIVDASGEAVTVTGGKLDVNASVDTTGLATSDNQTNGSQETQIVDAGGEAVTVTGGKLDVNASIDTTGLATSAKQDTGNTSLASIDGKITAVNTGAVVVSSSALPSGASTSAKQPALGTAGTASSDVITVQGIASMTALKVDGSAVTQPVSGTFWQATQPVSAASLPLPTGAATAALQTQPGVDIGDVTVNNTSGAGAVNIQDGGNSITIDGTVAATQSGSWVVSGNKTNNNAAPSTDNIGVLPAIANASSPTFTEGDQTLLSVDTAGNTRVTVNKLGGSVISTDNGTSGSGVQRVTIASNSTGQVALAAGSNTIGSLAANQSVNVAQMNGVTTSMGVGATGTGVQRVVLANDQGKTLLSAGGSASTSGNNTLVAAGTNRLKVYAFTLSTTSTTAVTCIFQSGAGGTELWRVVLQAPTSVSTGANLVVQPPAWLFATASATLLNLNLSSANAVNWSVSYFDES